MICTIQYNNNEFLCLNNQIVNNKKIKQINLVKKAKIFNCWSFFYEFFKIYKAYINRVSLFIENNIDICPYCGYEDKEKKIYFSSYPIKNNKFCWGSLTYHMIKKHYYEPPNSFIRYILSLSNIYYYKFQINDMLLFNSLLDLGGLTKKFKYLDKKKKNNKDLIHIKEYKYSEFSGYLDINCKNNKCTLDNIEISMDKRYEDGIYMVNFYLNKLSNRYYIFHTHPPTPTAGGRIQTDHIIYDLPSIIDINSFLDMAKELKIQGELIFAPEGIYVLTIKDRKQPIITTRFTDRTKFYQILNEAYFKYSYIDNEYDFYNIVIKDYSFIKKLNKIYRDYNLKLLYYPKELSYDYKMIYGKIYLPIYINKDKEFDIQFNE
jgi:hypothetical protein